jgi:hypothetical protein
VKPNTQIKTPAPTKHCKQRPITVPTKVGRETISTRQSHATKATKTATSAEAQKRNASATKRNPRKRKTDHITAIPGRHQLRRAVARATSRRHLSSHVPFQNHRDESPRTKRTSECQRTNKVDRPERRSAPMRFLAFSIPLRDMKQKQPWPLSLSNSDMSP